MAMPLTTSPSPLSSVSPRRSSGPSACSRGLLCNDLLKRRDVLAVEVSVDMADEFGFTQEASRFDDRALGMNPARFDPIQPGALNRQLTDHDPHTTDPLGMAVMRPNPTADFLAEMPTGIVPHQQQSLLAIGLQRGADARE